MNQHTSRPKRQQTAPLARIFFMVCQGSRMHLLVSTSWVHTSLSRPSAEEPPKTTRMSFHLPQSQ